MLEILVLNHEDINISRVQWYNFCKNAFAKSLPVPNTVTATTFAQLGEIIFEGEFLFSENNFHAPAVSRAFSLKQRCSKIGLKPSEIILPKCEYLAS